MLPDINLLPKKEKKENKSYYIFLICTIICLLLYGILTFFYIKTTQEIQTTEKEIEQLEMEQEVLQKKQDQLAHQEGDDWQASIHFIEQQVVPTSPLIHELMELLPEHAYVSDYTFQIETATLQTQFETLEAASLYTEKLQESAYVQEVKLEEVQTVPIQDIHKEEQEGYSFERMPRYDVGYVLVLDLQVIKEEANKDAPFISRK